jgi:regulator of cell morphogenesis and NO signaling
MVKSMNAIAQNTPLELLALPVLCDFLERDGHVWLDTELCLLDQLTRAAAERYAQEEPRLLQVRACFESFRTQFGQHLREEEESVFPVIRQVWGMQCEPISTAASLKHSLQRMTQAHFRAEELIADLRVLVAHSMERSSRTSVLRVIADALIRLEGKIHEQICAENRVLFSRALPTRGAA